MGKANSTQYRVLVGVNYPPHRRAEVGDVVGDIPDFAVNKLQQKGVIEKVQDEHKTRKPGATS